MVSFTTVTAVSVATFVAFIEPALGASMVVRAGVSILGSAIGNSGNKNKRAVSAEQQGDQQLQSDFATCMSTIHKNIPTMSYNADKSVDMGNLPDTCMKEVIAYNNQTNIAELDATHGRIIVKSSNAIHMDQIPADLHEMLEHKLGKPGSGVKTAPKEAAPKAAPKAN